MPAPVAGRRRALGGAGLALAVWLAAAVRPLPARADICVGDMWDNGAVSGGLVFPNWNKVWAGSFDILLCLAADCNWTATEGLLGVTVVNFGTATAADFKGVYWRASCTAPDTGLLTMTYAGLYTSDSGVHPAWTWAGTTASFAGCADLCGKAACGAFFTVDVYADIAPCPTDGATVALGFPTVAQTTNWAHWGSIYDSAGCEAPMYDVPGPERTIAYVFKQGSPDLVPPGDTVTYTVYYGRPGVNTLSGITITDTMPPFTHYVSGSAVPAPDPGSDPDWGPPPRLLWTIPGPLAVAGGPTGQVVFSLSVDWGNGDGFEPGSGDLPAPEGARLLNVAQVAFGNDSCSPAGNVSQPVDTVVRRFMMWMIGDNDLLFGPTMGQPADEIIYSIYVRNLSASKAWWQVTLWDTVPPELNVWNPGFGFDDPCAGWTMTPGGCAAASPGKVVAGAATLLTWRLDMPANATLSVRWKASVAPGSAPGDTATNILNLLAYGRTGIVGGTGSSVAPKRFAHLAPIILATTYVGYLGFACSQNCNTAGYFIDFFPLNRKTQFELRSLFYNGGGFASVGGVSASIGNLMGDCLGGFPAGGIAGCKAERIPAWFGMCTAGGCSYSVTEPIHHVYKLTSNSPVAWQLLSGDPGDPTVGWSHCGDWQTNVPATTLSYTGLMHYAWRVGCANGPTTPGYGSALNIINTGKDPYGVINPNLSTTVHLFRFNYGTLGWDYVRTYELGPEGAAFDDHTFQTEAGPWRTVSSEGQLIVIESFQFNNKDGCCCGCCGHNAATFAPSRETGTYVGNGTFYNYVYGPTDPTKAVIANVGATDAKIEMDRYVPTSWTGLVPGVPSQLEGTSGTWKPVASATVPAGFANPANPAIYDTNGPAYNASSFALVRTRVLSGGPIEIVAGERAFSIWSSGGQIHAITGQPVGSEFWLTPTLANNGVGGTCGTTPTQTVDVYAPKTGMVIQGYSETGAYSATYTSGGADQCVSFMNMPEPALKMNYKFKVLAPGGSTAVCQYLQCGWERGYSAPFLVTGTHYLIIAPAVVYSGQSFWLTIVVMDTSGSTKTDYCGTTSFTSTDPAAQILGTPMDGTNYTWTSNVGPGCGLSPFNDGVKIFVSVTLARLGLQSLIASDTADGSITGVTAIQVVGADVRLLKTPALSVQASGDTVQFRVCWSNFSSASAFTFVITDAIPDGTTFLPEAGTGNFDCGNTDGVAPVVGYNAAVSVTPPAAGWSNGNPLLGTRWLRFTLPQTGVGTTGCVCYRVTVN